MTISNMIWGDWQYLDFFNHRVNIEVTARQMRDTFNLNIASEVAIIDINGFRDYLQFGPVAAASITFEFWAGDTQGGLHQPKVRFRAVAPTLVQFTWIVTGRIIRRRGHLIGGETQLAGVADVNFRRRGS